MALAPKITTYYEVRNTEWDAGRHSVLPSPSQKTFRDEQAARETAEDIKGFYTRMNNSTVADGMYVSKVTVTRPHIITRFFNEVTDSFNLLILVAGVLFGVAGAATGSDSLHAVAGFLLISTLYTAAHRAVESPFPTSAY